MCTLACVCVWYNCLCMCLCVCVSVEEEEGRGGGGEEEGKRRTSNHSPHTLESLFLSHDIITFTNIGYCMRLVAMALE